MIFLHEQAQAVRQFEFPDRVLVFSSTATDNLGAVPSGNSV